MGSKHFRSNLKPARTLFRMLSGSRLYGTQIEHSDKDIKSVILPSGEDILLGKACFKSKKSSSKLDKSAKSQENDTDFEEFSLYGFLHAVVQGQTTATEMLFSSQPITHLIWERILNERDKLINKELKGFISASLAYRKKYAKKKGSPDWKDIMHSVRISEEAIELLTQKKITFPRPNAPHLVHIRLGELPYEEVEKELLANIKTLDALKEKNTGLNKGYPHKIIKNIILEAYGSQIA